jgi:hypothetical protein
LNAGGQHVDDRATYGSSTCCCGSDAPRDHVDDGPANLRYTRTTGPTCSRECSRDRALRKASHRTSNVDSTTSSSPDKFAARTKDVASVRSGIRPAATGALPSTTIFIGYFLGIPFRSKCLDIATPEAPTASLSDSRQTTSTGIVSNCAGTDLEYVRCFNAADCFVGISGFISSLLGGFSLRLIRWFRFLRPLRLPLVRLVRLLRLLRSLFATGSRCAPCAL